MAQVNDALGSPPEDLSPDAEVDLVIEEDPVPEEEVATGEPIVEDVTVEDADGDTIDDEDLGE